MDQSRAINALAPFVALAKSANSPRAAADLVTQATSAANTYVFAELLQQPNVQALASHEQYANFLTLLELFAWGTWEDYQKASTTLPPLSSTQAQKLRLLSLLTFAAQKSDSPSEGGSTLSYQSLCHRLDLPSPLDLEQLVITALYNDLLKGTLNPASQTVIITSVAPLRDIAPGSVQTMIAELTAWSSRCEDMLAGLVQEVNAVKMQSEKRAKREWKAESQIRVVMEAAERNPGGKMGRGAKREQTGDLEEEEDDGDAMDVDSGTAAAPKKKGGVAKQLFKRLS